MSYHSLLFRINAARCDAQRNQAIALPAGVTERRDISYGRYGKWNHLDVYYPDGTQNPLPTIVSIHGGAYVYGDKEVYRRYCMDLARRGFSVVNFTYRLAPDWKFPVPLEDTNAVMQWLCANAESYHLDPKRLFLVGDSAGAQLASQYAAIATNPDYAACFKFTVPDITIRAVGLNCGMYNAPDLSVGPLKSIAKDYLGTKIGLDDPRLQVLEHITDRFPPAHITTSCHDFLRHCAEPMATFLSEKGIPVRLDCYGSEDNEAVGHVFHCNIILPEAVECNDAQCAYFRSFL